MMYVTVEPQARMWIMMMKMILLMVCLIFLLFDIYYFVIIIIIITHREITISGVVPKLESDNTTPSLTRSFKRRSLFDVQSGCIRQRRVRGSQCARFEIRTVGGREDIYNTLLLILLQGGDALWNITRQYYTRYILLWRLIMMLLDCGLM